MPKLSDINQSNTTRDAILDAAEHVFAEKGYAGATVKYIARRAGCYESLIYYHFGNKEKLFTQVLKNAYQKLIQAELQLDLDFDSPERALSQIVLFMWDYYQENPELIILLNTENLLKGKHLKQLNSMQEFLSPTLELLERIVQKGCEKGLFREGIDIRELYLTIMGLGYFYLSNQYTLSIYLGRELLNKEERDKWGRCVVDTVLSSVRANHP